jgi:hypothetical protein
MEICGKAVIIAGKRIVGGNHAALRMQGCQSCHGLLRFG